MEGNRLIFFLAFTGLLIAQSTYSQQKYWVHFADKNGTPFSLQKPESFLGQKSVARRQMYKIPLHESDLPVNPSYINAVDTVRDVTVLFASKWLNGIVISVPNATVASQALAVINSFPFVRSNSRVKRMRVSADPETFAQMPDWSAKGAVAGSAQAVDYGYAGWQTKQLNLDCLHDKGFLGEGMLIGVMDAGFLQVDINPFFENLRARGGIVGTRDFVTGGSSVYEDSEHGAQVLSCMAADISGIHLGTAPKADYWLFRTEETAAETVSEEYIWIRAAEFADSVGCDVITTSLGYTEFDIPEQNHSVVTLNGRTAPMSIASTMAARKGIFVLTAAGNEGGNAGWQGRISVPADADSVCAVGAIDSLSAVAVFSGKGPTADGRIKPDLVAMGVGTALGGLSGTPIKGNGTSFATPVLAGAVACYWQANRPYNNIEVFAALKRHASHASSPNNSRGWGTPNLCSTVYDRDFDFSAWFAGNDRSYLQVNIIRSNYKAVKMQLVDMNGKIHHNANIDGGLWSVRFDVVDLPKGIYILKLSTENSEIVRKLVKL